MRKLFIYLFILIGCSNSDISDQEAPPDKDPSEFDADVNHPKSDAGKIDGSVKDAGKEASTPVGCASTKAKCQIGETCQHNSDCASTACDYRHQCIESPSCINHFGGDTCGLNEVESANNQHENCCKYLPVPGFNDPSHINKTTYLDKYEITSGRIRTFIEAISQQLGKPNLKSWVQSNRPQVWNKAWEIFLPTDYNSGYLTINRLLLGDPRHDHETNPGPGVIVPPETDQSISLGIYAQLGAPVYADVHGNNCGTFDGSWGFPTYYLPPEVLTQNNEIPRKDGKSDQGRIIPAQQWLDVKSINCIPNWLLQLFCHWDTNGNGQLATSEVLDYITQSPVSLRNTSGCGTQIDYHGAILGGGPDNSIRSGGKCPSLSVLNVNFDAGQLLPVNPNINPGNYLNPNRYHYPDLGANTSDKAWQIAAPGRLAADSIKISPNQEGWMDLAGNLNEVVLETKQGIFTGYFGLKYRGVGYGSARSDLNVSYMPGESILRIQRPEVKAAFSGGRCMRYK